MLLLTAAEQGATARRLADFGGLVDMAASPATATYAILRDAIGYDLFVMDCDGFGGVEAGEAMVAALIAADARMRIILVSREFDMPALPMGLRSVVCLPATCADASFRRGYDHALRDRVSLLVM